MVKIYQIEIAMRPTRDFASWLESSMEKYKGIEGLLFTKWWQRPPDSNLKKDGLIWTIQFHLSDERALKEFVAEHAPGFQKSCEEHFKKLWKGAPQKRIIEQDT